MTAPDRLADATDPRFTDDQRATLARFETAPTPPEVREARGLEAAKRAMREEAHRLTYSDDLEPWPSENDLDTLAAAAVAAYRAVQDGGAEEAVRRVDHEGLPWTEARARRAAGL